MPDGYATTPTTAEAALGSNKSDYSARTTARSRVARSKAAKCLASLLLQSPHLEQLLELAMRSMPLARGKPISDYLEKVTDRFIPAHAGNTAIKNEHGPPSPVHPRSRGEHMYRRAVELEDRGSSPLTRGTLEIEAVPIRARRFIPAGAGNTAPARRYGKAASVHPRWRGEHYRNPSTGKVYGGSSPLARGTPAN